MMSSLAPAYRDHRVNALQTQFFGWSTDFRAITPGATFQWRPIPSPVCDRQGCQRVDHPAHDSRPQAVKDATRA